MKQMKQQRRYTVSLLMTAMMAGGMVLMAACADGSLVDDNHGEVPIVLTTVVQETGADVSRATANLQSTQLAASENIYATFSGYSGSVTKANAIYTSNGNGTTTIADAANQPYFTISGTSTTVNAYHGKSGGASGTQVTEATTSFSVALDQSSDAAYKASDLMHASTIITKIGPTACGVLQFTHKMSKIAVNASSTDLQIQAVRIVGGNSTIALSNDGSCTLGATSSPLSTSSYITMYAGGSNSTASCAALIPPQTITGSFMEVITNAGTITYSLSSKTFVSGMSYVYTIIATAGSIGLTIDVSDWDNLEITDLVNNESGSYQVAIEPVDLGLSVRWANMNIGATSSTGYGTYFAWGETSGYTVVGATDTPDVGNVKTIFSWANYSLCQGSYSTLTKYSNNASYWLDALNNDTPDGITQLELADDAAHANWGGDWRMPTQGELAELVGGTDIEWTTINGVNGRKFMKKGDHSVYIFLPAASGCGSSGMYNSQGSSGIYWSSSLRETYPYFAMRMRFDAINIYYTSDYHYRSEGYSVRAVCPVYDPLPYTSLSDATSSDVGKVICSNGHLHRTVGGATAAGCVPSGIIAYIGAPGSVDASSSTYRGLAISLENCSSTNCSDWNGNAWCSQNSANCTSSGNITTDNATAVTLKNGISATAELANHASHIHYAAKSAQSYNVSRPSGASGWFLPSVGQWNLIAQGLMTKSTGSPITNNLMIHDKNPIFNVNDMNRVIINAGGSVISIAVYNCHSSTEYSSSQMWMMYGSCLQIEGKTDDYIDIRAVFAF